MLLGLLLTASFTQAQHHYFGIGLDLFSDFSTGAAPLLSLQYGAEVMEKLELRGSLNRLAVVNLLSADVLYKDQIPDEKSFYYLGGGLDL
jgi:hypothetical protein